MSAHPLTGLASVVVRPFYISCILAATVLVENLLFTGEVAAQSTDIDESSAGVAPDNLANRQEYKSRAIDEIIVTAQKRRQRLIDVPSAISVIQGEDLLSRGATEFDDLTNNIPGMSFRQDFGGSNAPSIVIRGVGFDDFRASGSPSAALHLDGVYLGSNGFLTGQLFDVERVEVLKGPQGTLYGRNSTAGVVNIISKTPGEKLEAFINAEYGNFESARIEAGIGGPVTDQWGLRVAGMYETSDGYFESLGTDGFEGFTPVPGVVPPLEFFPAEEDYGDVDMFAFRVTSVFEPSPNTQLALRGNYTRDKSEIAADIAGFAFGFTEPDDDPFKVFTNIDTQVDSDIWGVSLELKQRLTDTLDLTAIGAFESLDRVAPFNEGSPFRASDTLLQDDLEQTTFELRVGGSPLEGVDFTTGFFYLDDTGNFDNEIIAIDGLNSILIQDNLQKRESWAVFGQADWRFAEKWTVTGGLRFTDEKASLVGSTFDPDPFGATITPFIFDFPIEFDNRFSDDNISGRLSLSYAFANAGNVYVAVSRGFKSGGFDGSGLFTEEEALPFDSEELLAIESGLKTVFYDGKININLAAFYYDFSDLQATTSVRFTPGGTPTNVRTNVADATSYGGELEVNWNPVTDFNVGLGLALLDTEIDNFISDNPEQVARRVGNELPDSPNITFNFAVDYSHEIVSGWAANFLVTGRYQDEAFKELDNFQAVPSFFDGTARVGIQEPDGRWEIAGWVRNFTDDTYFTTLLADESGNGLRIPAAPRTYGISLSASF